MNSFRVLCGSLRMLFSSYSYSLYDCIHNPQITPVQISPAALPLSLRYCHPLCPMKFDPCSPHSSLQYSISLKDHTNGINGDFAVLSLMLLQSTSASQG